MVPMVAVAACEAELSYFATSVDLFTKVKKIHDINKKLFALDKLTKDELDISLVRLEKSANLVLKTQKLYKECQHKDMI
jgi:hypothetical protein